MAKQHIQDGINYGFIVKGMIDDQVFYIDSSHTNQVHPEVEFIEDEIPHLRSLSGRIQTHDVAFPINIYFSNSTDVAAVCKCLSTLSGIANVHVVSCARILGMWENGELVVRRKLSDFYEGITEADELEASF